MERHFITDNMKRTIEFRGDPNDGSLDVFHEGRNIGGIRFDFVDDHQAIHVTWMFLDRLDGYKRCGIGTDLIEWIKEETGLHVFFSSDDGHKKGDGSHLTGDAPAFVESLKRKKIVR